MNRKLSDDEAERILAEARDLLSRPLQEPRERSGHPASMASRSRYAYCSKRSEAPVARHPAKVGGGSGDEGRSQSRIDGRGSIPPLKDGPAKAQAPDH
jgi:hypothetical protein